MKKISVNQAYCRKLRSCSQGIITNDWVSVQFIDDGKLYKCPNKRVLDCIKYPDIYNVIWTDGKKYHAKILQRGDNPVKENKKSKVMKIEETKKIKAKGRLCPPSNKVDIIGKSKDDVESLNEKDISIKGIIKGQVDTKVEKITGLAKENEDDVLTNIWETKERKSERLHSPSKNDACDKKDALNKFNVIEDAAQRLNKKDNSIKGGNIASKVAIDSEDKKTVLADENGDGMLTNIWETGGKKSKRLLSPSENDDCDNKDDTLYKFDGIEDATQRSNKKDNSIKGGNIENKVASDGEDKKPVLTEENGDGILTNIWETEGRKSKRLHSSSENDVRDNKNDTLYKFDHIEDAAQKSNKKDKSIKGGDIKNKVASADEDEKPGGETFTIKDEVDFEIRNREAVHEWSEEECSDDNDLDYVPGSDTDSDQSLLDFSYSRKKAKPFNLEIYSKSNNLNEGEDKVTNFSTDSVSITAITGEQTHVVQGVTEDDKSNTSSNTSFVIPYVDKSTSKEPHPSYFVRTCSGKTANGKRKFDKVHYCVYCNKPYKQLPKHFERKHKNELEVMKLMSLDKKNKIDSDKRKLILLKLRCKGDFIHNSEVYRKGVGMIISSKSTTEPKNPEDYRSCRFCGTSIMRVHLFRHLNNCKLKPSDYNNKRRRVQCAASLLTPPVHTASEGLIFYILNNMQDDDVTAAIRRDYIVLQYGSKEYSKVSHNSHKYRNVSGKLREMGHLLLALKEDHPNKGLADFIAPQHYNDIVRATKKAAKWDETTGNFGNPNLALKIGFHLLKIAHIKIRDGLTGTKTTADVVEAEQFLKLREREWNSDIASHAHRIIEQRKRNAPIILPVVNDILILQKYLKDMSEKYFQQLSNDFSDRNAWYELCRITLVMVILFNRRRSGEASNMLVSDYLDRSQTPLEEDISSALSDFEKTLLKNLTRFEVEGKTKRAVPVILTNKMKRNIDLLIKTRGDVGVNPNNPHLFARPYFDAITPVTGSECLKRFVKASGAKYPENITATKLRKHIATVSQVFNLTEGEIELLCSHMGHDPKIHRKFYRLPEGTLQVAKLSRILIAMEQGQAHLYKGKKLDEIEFDPDEALEVDAEVLDDDDGDELQLNDNERKNTDHIKGAKSIDYTLDKNISGEITSNLEVKNKQKRKNKAITQRIPWSAEEKKAVLKNLAPFLRELKVPGKNDCNACKMQAGEVLGRRDWKSIKFFVKNEITKKNKQTK